MGNIAEVFKSLMDKYGEILLEKKRRVWLACLFSISSGLFVWQTGWMPVENSIKFYNEVIFVLSIVALAMWSIEYIWEKNKEKNRANEERERVKALVKKKIEGFSLNELEFLMRFDEKSKRTTVRSEEQEYLNLSNLGVISYINSVGEGAFEQVHVEIDNDYKEEWNRLKERFDEEIQKNIIGFSDEMLIYLKSFEKVIERDKSAESFKIEEKMEIFKLGRRASLKDGYRRCILDAKKEIGRRDQKREELEAFLRQEEEQREAWENSKEYDEYLENQEDERAKFEKDMGNKV